MYQVIIESGKHDTQPYIFKNEYQMADFIKLIMRSFDYEVTVTIKKMGV